MDEFINENVVRLSVEFTNSSGTAVDPDAVSLWYDDPSGNPTEVSSPTKASTGNYYYDLTLDEAGQWLWRWEGTGANAAVDQGRFRCLVHTFEET